MGMEEFNQAAATAALWTAGQLSARVGADTWSMLPQSSRRRLHAGARQPARPEWEYLLTSPQDGGAVRAQDDAVRHSSATRTCPFLARSATRPRVPTGPPTARRDLGDSRLIINPGSVGQPARRRPPRRLRPLRLGRPDRHVPPRRLRHRRYPASHGGCRPLPLADRAAQLRAVGRISRRDWDYGLTPWPSCQ